MGVPKTLSFRLTEGDGSVTGHCLQLYRQRHDAHADNTDHASFWILGSQLNVYAGEKSYANHYSTYDAITIAGF